MRIMIIKGSCPECKSAFSLCVKQDNENPSCEKCNTNFNKTLLNEMWQTKTVTACPICGFNDFWIDKKFPKKIGLMLVIIAAILVPFTWGFSFVILFLLDVILWIVLEWRINCYKCSSEFIGFKRNSKMKYFDLKVYDYYKKEQESGKN